MNLADASFLSRSDLRLHSSEYSEAQTDFTSIAPLPADIVDVREFIQIGP